MNSIRSNLLCCLYYRQNIAIIIIIINGRNLPINHAAAATLTVSCQYGIVLVHSETTGMHAVVSLLCFIDSSVCHSD